MKILFPLTEFKSLISEGDLGVNLENLITKLSLVEGNEIQIVFPFYKSLLPFKNDITPLMPEVIIKNISGHEVKFWKTEINGLVVYLVDNDFFFGTRVNIYGYENDCYRFVFFCLSVIELLKHINFTPDIIHVSDWCTSLIPLLLKLNNYEIKTVYSINNISYQGICDPEILNFANIGQEYFSTEKLEFYNKINFSKAGIIYCNLLTTNSKNYLEIIQESIIHSHGLNGILKYFSPKSYGVPLGIDDDYDPETDAKINTNYSVSDLSGKTICKTELQKELNFPIHTEIPILVIPSTHISEAEIRIINSIIPYLIRMEIQIIILGNKLVDFEKNIHEASFRLNCTVISVEDNDENLRKIFSGADIFLDTSFEAIHDHLIKTAFRYGVIPIVLKESVDLADIEDCRFRLFNFTTEDLINTIKYTINRYYYLEKWNEKVKKVMVYDSSWKKTTNTYMELYNKISKP